MTSSRLRVSATAVAALAVAAPFAHADDILFKTRPGHALRAGKFGPVAEFQRGLATAAASCGAPVSDPSAFADGTIGANTRAAVKVVAKCRLYAGQIGHPDAAASGALTSDLWKAVAPAVSIPDAAGRAYLLTLNYEGTDYTDVEFNVGTTDPGVLTWGPLGATAGQAHQVQRILREIDKHKSVLITSAFGSEASIARTFAQTKTDDAAAVIVTAVKSDPARRAQWKAAFHAIGEDPEARKIYGDQMWAPGGAGLLEGVNDFFRSYWSYCLTPSELDYAYFLDRAVQMNVRQELTDQALLRARNAELRAARTFVPAERRRAISVNFVGKNKSMVADRLARDVGYYLDALPAPTLTDASFLALAEPGIALPSELKGEVATWTVRSGWKGSDIGLGDVRAAPAPKGLKPPVCVGGSG